VFIGLANCFCGWSGSVFVVPINLLNGLEFHQLYIIGYILDAFDFLIRLNSMCRQ